MQLVAQTIIEKELWGHRRKGTPPPTAWSLLLMNQELSSALLSLPSRRQGKTIYQPLVQTTWLCFTLSACKPKKAGVALLLIEVINGSGADFSQILFERNQQGWLILKHLWLLCPTPLSVSRTLLLVLDEHTLDLAMSFCLGAGRVSSEKQPSF